MPMLSVATGLLPPVCAATPLPATITEYAEVVPLPARPPLMMPVPIKVPAGEVLVLPEFSSSLSRVLAVLGIAMLPTRLVVDAWVLTPLRSVRMFVVAPPVIVIAPFKLRVVP